MKLLQNKKHFKGFTLVELIIVITILGILATIAFISFQGYTKDARDGIRMSDIKQIYNGLSIYKTQTEKTLLPDNYINIQSGTTTISYQGYAGASVLRTLKISGGKDPGTKDYYIYTTDVNTKKAQLMTYMETSDKDVQLLSQLKDLNIINQAQALTNTGYYQDKKIYVYGDKIGILTNSNKVPLQETTTSMGIDITSLTGNITAYFGGTIYNSGTSTSTGQTLVNQIVGAINNTKVCDTGYSLIGGNCIAQNIEIANSLRFDGSRSTYLQKSFQSGNRKKWTWSGWVKVTNSNSSVTFFDSSDLGGPTNETIFRLNSNHNIQFISWDDNNGTITPPSNGVLITDLATSFQLTSVDKWYHILLKVDTTQLNNEDKVVLYINGQNILFDAVPNYGTIKWPVKDKDLAVNKAQAHFIGRVGYASVGYMDGYMSEINFIDGNAHGPENFGINIGGKWLPKKYEGTYGTNGFHLDFSNSGNLGDDVAGTNDWNLVNYSTPANDQMIDTPTNNFATLNPNDKGTTLTLSNGNLTSTIASGQPESIARSTIGTSSGKWYFETTLLTQSSPVDAPPAWGLALSTTPKTGTAGGADSWVLRGGSTPGYAGKSSNNAFSGPWTTPTVNYTYKFAFDVDSGKMWIGDQNGWFNGGNPDLGTGFIYSNLSGKTVFPIVDEWGTSKSMINFGQGGQSGLSWCSGAGGYFKYCPPTGFKTLSSKNIGN